MARIILLGFWAIVIASLFIPMPGALNDILPKVGGLLLVFHVVEFFIFRQAIAAKGHDTAKSFLMTLVYGIAYIKSR